MYWKRFVTALLAGGMLWACSSESSGPSSDPASGEVSATATDPTGDPFGNRGVMWDITAMTVTRDTEAVTVALTFSSNLISPAGGDTNAMIAFIDLDTDQDSATGKPTMADEFRRDSGSTAMSSDFRIDLATYDAEGTTAVFDESGTITGRVKPVFSGRKVTVRIPRSLLGGDDGFLNAAAIVGQNASPTDIVPQAGHLELNAGAAGLR